jgi:hypothetical protein
VLAYKTIAEGRRNYRLYADFAERRKSWRI